MRILLICKCEVAKNIESHSIASSRLRERGLCVPQPALTLGWGYPQVRSYGAEFNTSGVGWTGLRSGHVNVPGKQNQKPSGLTSFEFSHQLVPAELSFG
ncbi:MAG: hypothetical protein HDS59_02640 [Barnesiella sp.]|nr:hypothetical protein [Barnesiella sp.]